MTLIKSLSLFIIIFFINNFLIKNIIPYLGKIFLDIPNSRSSHNSEKLKGGGIFFVSTSLIVCIIEVYLNGINELSIAIFVCSLMAIIGLLDDLIDVSAYKRYLFQILISATIIFINQSYVSLSLPLTLLLIIFGTAIINITNFMDGIDGLVAGCFIVLLIFKLINSFNYQIIALISSILVFLKWNWYPSKLFMGDCGSNFIGSFIFYLFLSTKSKLIDPEILLIMLPLLLDSSTCILRRLLNKENIFKAHKKHLYQRLHQNGISHSNISTIYISFCLLNLFSVVLSYQNLFIFMILLQISVGYYLDKYFAVRFNKA